MQPLRNRTRAGRVAVSGFSSLVVAPFLLVSACRGTSEPAEPCLPGPSPDLADPASQEAQRALDAEAERAEFDPPRADGGPEPTTTLQRAGGQAGAQEPLLTDPLRELDEWAKKNGGRARGIALDLTGGEVLVRLESDVAVNPASTQKLLTAGAALSLLGPAYRFKTEVWVTPGAGPNLSAVELSGGGAPDFATEDLIELSRDFRRSEVSEIGVIRVDQSRFSGSYLPPAYDEQPGEWAAFRAPISALALDKNTISLHVSPRGEGQPTLLWLSPPGLSRVEGEVLTGAPKSGDRVRWDLSPSQAAPGLSSRLGGSLGVDASAREYSRRVEDPRLGAGYALTELLREVQIRVPGGVLLESRRSDKAKLWRSLRSAPLAVLIRELGKDSDNFSAEMLAVALSDADRDAPKTEAWSTERGMKVLKAWLSGLGLHPETAVLRNGSGLFGANKVSCDLIVGVLSEMARGSSAASDYQSQLAIGGVDGTLRERFGRAEWAQRVRGKTGTLRDTDALAGYIYPSGVGQPIAFSIVVSGVSGKHAEARQRIDRVVESLAAWKRPEARAKAAN